MKYPTAEEARAIIENGNVLLCLNSIDNPNLEAAQVLIGKVKQGRYDPFFAAVTGFILGRAIESEKSEHVGRRAATV